MAVRVYLDTNVFIRALQGHEQEALPVRQFLKFPKAHEGAGLTSDLTLAELLVPRDPLVKRMAFNLLLWNDGISLRSVTRQIPIQSAEVRQRIRHKLPDAIHIATAIDAQCQFMMAADKDMERMPASLVRVMPDAAGIQYAQDAMA